LLVAALSAALTACGGSDPVVADPAARAADLGPLAADSPARPFVGTYRFAGSDAERQAIDHAIDVSVSQLGSFVRGFARKRLAAANRVPAELVMKAGGNAFVVLVDNRPYSGLLDGKATTVTVATGDVMDMSFKFGSDMVQTFADREKGRVNTFELRGNQLVMHVRVYAKELPEDVKYDLTFNRQ
jgi:hypothetical protein